MSAPSRNGEATERAVEAAKEAYRTHAWSASGSRWQGREVTLVEAVVLSILEAAHFPALGDARSVNERWCREGQTRKIVETLREFQYRARSDEQAEAFARAADLIESRFGGSGG